MKITKMMLGRMDEATEVKELALSALRNLAAQRIDVKFASLVFNGARTALTAMRTERLMERDVVIDISPQQKLLNGQKTRAGKKVTR